MKHVLKPSAILIVFAVSIVIAAASAGAQMPADMVQMNPFQSGLGTRIDNWRCREGDFPEAAKPGFDDSAWETTGLGKGWNSSIYWFRSTFTVPAEADGKAISFYGSINDAGTVYVDGEKLYEFRGNGSAMLTRSAVAGTSYSISIRANNTQGAGKFDYFGFSTISSESLIAIDNSLKKLSKLTTVNAQPVTGWLYKESMGKKAANPDTDTSDWTAVMLPNSMPDTVSGAWYRTEFTRPGKINGFSTEGGAVTLDFSLKTSGTLYINGKKVKTFQQTESLDITRKLPPGEKITLAIKVTDISMDGGLRSVTVHATALDQVKKNTDDLIARVRFARMFFEQHPAPPRELADAIHNIDSTTESLLSIKDPVELSTRLNKLNRSLDSFESFLADYPIFHQGPYLQNVTQNSITVMWETLVPATSELHYGRKFLNKVIRDDTPKTIHELTITGLEPETEYVYAAASNRLAAPTSSFRTAIHRDTPFKFAVWGDNRTDPVSHESVIESMIRSNPDIAINVGDVVTRGEVYAQWSREYFLPMRRFAINKPVFVAIGNHEYGGYGYGSRVPWFDKFVAHPAPNDYYYSFVYGNSFFLVLNPQDEVGAHQVRPGSDQYKWMMEQFESEAYKNATFRFAFFHEPPYSECWSGGYYDGEPMIRKDLVPLFEKYKMDIVFAGHTHDYERGQWPKPDGPYYIISGGGGASLDDTQYKDWEQIEFYAFLYHHILVTIDGGKLKFEALDRNDKLFDSFEIIRD